MKDEQNETKEMMKNDEEERRTVDNNSDNKDAIIFELNI